MLLVVSTPTWGTESMKYWMIEVAVVTIPEGTVNGPEICLPKNSVLKTGLCQLAQVGGAMAAA